MSCVSRSLLILDLVVARSGISLALTPFHAIAARTRTASRLALAALRLRVRAMGMSFPMLDLPILLPAVGYALRP